MQSIAPAPPQSMQNQDMSADNDLRAQLAAVINTSQHGGPPPPGASNHPHPHGAYNDVHAHHHQHQQSSSASPHDHNIDPAIGGGIGGGGGGPINMSTGGDSGGDDSLGDGRKGGKRELSQSKRAAQNRAAQRAFRQRKEGYIKKLEEQVRDLHNLEDNFKALQAENYSLREYIIHLQSRLIESQGDYPQPPPNVNLIHPHAGRGQQQQQHDPQASAPMAPMSTLQASAARTLAAAGLAGKPQQQQHQHPGAEEYDHSKRYKDEGHDNPAADEEIIRSQLQGTADGLPSSM
ncbi:uncharacterized protein LY89DRAFT_139123 [Mollisia scopiformis]|uniref:Putative transcription factor kapC n=1 Tax=Mollisia scopiformis TaxID=149040 RepID=A0A194X2N1_MOLSC|nr:uncharacterized protein LY89DRAFT_139123 [Mollisia scopiformis]KUJ14443.1 hypothetical protein LY89DRAFT_139123 [Mollisia scopiformis]